MKKADAQVWASASVRWLACSFEQFAGRPRLDASDVGVLARAYREERFS